MNSNKLPGILINNMPDEIWGWEINQFLINIFEEKKIMWRDFEAYMDGIEKLSWKGISEKELAVLQDELAWTIEYIKECEDQLPKSFVCIIERKDMVLEVRRTNGEEVLFVPKIISV